MKADTSSFMDWLGNELRTLSTGNMHDGLLQRDIVTNAIRHLRRLPAVERRKVLELLLDSHKTGMIGGLRIRFDMRDESDAYEEIVSLLEAHLENEPD